MAKGSSNKKSARKRKLRKTQEDGKVRKDRFVTKSFLLI